ncbi:unnamed protein product [Owenia fusiformis]|uniref:Uncharacterized protein n=1 Tax=Owenia fusiformis TaxID=6347 RepID=A0A8J1U7L8_OWEFU|nr:unnamed protein product [Owenia fusiformis]
MSSFCHVKKTFEGNLQVVRQGRIREPIRFGASQDFKLAVCALTDVQVNSSGFIDGAKVIDLRSDTVTQPSDAMREAMASAKCGDDVYNEDPTVNELQRKCAEMFGKEAALFVPTGTMGNLISVMTHCQGRGQELICGDKSHVFLYEQGGVAHLAGINPCLVPNQPDGTINVDQLQAQVRGVDVHYPVTKLICLENTHNFCGGKVLPMAYLEKVESIARENDVKIHMDGARVLNAATALDIPVADIVKHADSVSMCFSKGLGAPVGSIMAGTEQFVNMALRIRKMLGGGMRQVAVLAAPALVALEESIPKLADDHKHARIIARGIKEKQAGIEIDMEGLHTNILVMEFMNTSITPQQFVQRLFEVTEEEKRVIGGAVSVKLLAIASNKARLVTHRDITTDDIHLVMKKILYVLDEFKANT